METDRVKLNSIDPCDDKVALGLAWPGLSLTFKAKAMSPNTKTKAGIYSPQGKAKD